MKKKLYFCEAITFFTSPKKNKKNLKKNVHHVNLFKLPIVFHRDNGLLEVKDISIITTNRLLTIIEISLMVHL
jgi:hypothetical protein